jgi:putative intracellular protease/amidase
MRKTVLIPVADGSEELEAVAIIDVLRRAGATVTVASVTCHPAFVDQLTNPERVDARVVVVDGNCLTSRGPGTAVEFALALVERLYGKARREEVAGAMVV